MSVRKSNAEHGAGQHLGDAADQFNGLFFCHFSYF
jgi:hypothetical protein